MNAACERDAALPVFAQFYIDRKNDLLWAVNEEIGLSVCAKEINELFNVLLEKIKELGQEHCRTPEEELSTEAVKARTVLRRIFVD